MAHEISAAIGKTGDIRLLPLATRGGADNLRELAFLRGVDLAIVPANLLSQTKALEASLGAGLSQRLGYVTHLYAEEVHVLVGSGVDTVEGLERRKVAVPLDDGTAEFTAKDLLERLGVVAEVVKLHQSDAIAQIRSGEIAAALFVGGKPHRLISGLPKDGRIRLLRVPFVKAMDQGYLPGAFRAEDYSALIPPGVSVETVAISAVLMANIGKGYEESSRRIAKLIPVLFASVADMMPLGRNPKWAELNLAAPLPGWTRFPAAEEWLRNAREEQKAILQKDFEAFLRSNQQPGAPEMAPAQRKKLFDDFVTWTRKSLGAAKDAAQP